MLRNYYNSAILTVRELKNGVDKLARIKGESQKDYNKRRKLYAEKSKRKSRR